MDINIGLYRAGGHWRHHTHIEIADVFLFVKKKKSVRKDFCVLFCGETKTIFARLVKCGFDLECMWFTAVVVFHRSCWSLWTLMTFWSIGDYSKQSWHPIPTYENHKKNHLSWRNWTIMSVVVLLPVDTAIRKKILFLWTQLFGVCLYFQILYY